MKGGPEPAPPSYPRLALHIVLFAILAFVLMALGLGLVFASGKLVASATGRPFEPFGDDGMSLEAPILIPFMLAQALGVVLATALYRKQLRISWVSAGLRRSRRLLDMAAGFGVGAGSFALVALLAAPFGLVEVSAPQLGLHTLGTGLLAALILLPASAHEEIAFRGLALAMLARRNVVMAAIVTSILFSLIHLPNPGAGWIGSLNVFTAGIALAVARIRTGALWLPIGWHLGWNLTQGWVFGCVVSGVDASNAPILSTRFTGPTFLTGGEFGPESGLLAVIANLIALFVFLRLFPKRNEPGDELGPRGAAGAGDALRDAPRAGDAPGGP